MLHCVGNAVFSARYMNGNMLLLDNVFEVSGNDHYMLPLLKKYVSIYVFYSYQRAT